MLIRECKSSEVTIRLKCTHHELLLFEFYLHQILRRLFPSANEVRLINQLKAFKIFDTNKDGVVSIKEMTKVLKEREIEPSENVSRL
jgi:hypothetical protein